LKTAKGGEQVPAKQKSSYAKKPIFTERKESKMNKKVTSKSKEPKQGNLLSKINN